MKYKVASKCRKFAIMRRNVVKFLATLLVSISFVPSYAELVFPEAQTGLTYEGKAQVLHTEPTDVPTGYQWQYKYESDTKWVREISEKKAGTYNFNYRLNSEDPSTYVTISGEVDGYTYVDLGLSDGVLWATYCVGATSPTTKGKYFQWAGTTGYSSSSAAPSAAPYTDSDGMFTKYCESESAGKVDNKTQIEAIDDAATQSWGKNWRMPTSTEYSNLTDGCDWKKVSDYMGSGIPGVIGISKTNGNIIFFPYDDSYWTSTKATQYMKSYDMGVWFLFNTAYSSGYSLPGSRNDAKLIRPVSKAKGNSTTGEITATIAPRKMSIQCTGTWNQSLNAYVFTYDGTEQCPKVSLMQNDFYSDDNVKIVTTGEKTLPGTYTALAKFESTDGSDKNYIFSKSGESTLEIPFVIKKASVKIETGTYPGLASPNKITYDGNSYLPLTKGTNTTSGEWRYYTVSGTLADPYGDLTKFSSDVEEVTNAGTYTTYYIFVPKYSDIYEIYKGYSYTFTINPAEVSIALTNATGEYSGKKQVPKLTVTGLSNADKNYITISSSLIGTSGDGKSVGTHKYEVSITGPSLRLANYSFPTGDDLIFSYKITAKEVKSIKWDYEDKKVPYTGEDIRLCGDVTDAVEGDDVYACTKTVGRVPDTYTSIVELGGDQSGNYVLASSASKVTWEIYDPKITLNSFKSVPTTILSPNPITYDGEEHVPFNVPSAPDTENGEPAGHWEYYTAFNSNVCDESNFTKFPTKAKKVGKYRTFYKFVPDDASIKEFYDGNGLDFEITPKTLHVTWPTEKQTFPYGEAHMLTPTLDRSGLATADKDANIDVKGCCEQFGPASNLYTTASLIGDADIIKNYEIAEEDYISPTFVIESPKHTKDVTFTAPTPKTNLEYKGANVEQELFTPGKVLVSEGSLVYRFEGDTKWESSPLTGSKAGTYFIEYMVTGGKTYLTSGIEGPIEVTIAPKPVTIEWKGSPFTYNGKEQLPTPSLVGLLDEDVDNFKVTASAKEGDDCTTVGSHTAVASISLTTSDLILWNCYSFPEDLEYSYEITAAEKIKPTGVTGPIKLSDPEFDCHGDYLVSEGKSKTVKGTFLYWEGSDLPAGETPSWTDEIPRWYFARTYVVHSKFVPADLDTYEEVVFEDITVDVKKKIIDIEWFDTEKDYDGEYPKTYAEVADPTALCTSSDYLKFDYVYEDGLPKEVGTYKVTASIVDGTFWDSYEISATTASTYVTIKETLTPLTLTLTREGWTYGGDATANLLKGNEECKGAESYTYYTDAECTVKTTEADGASVEGGEPKNPGTYNVVVNVAATETCEGGSAKASFTIAKKEIKPLWQSPATGFTSVSLTYNGEEQAPTVQLRQIEVADVEDVTYVLSGKETNVGTGYTASIVLTGDKADRYVIKEGFDALQYNIDPVQVTVEWSETLEVEYTGVEVYPEASIKAGDILAADAEKVKLVITGAIEVGPQTATASLTGVAAKNYEITVGKTQEFTIKESETPLTPLTLELTRDDWTYGEDATTAVLKGNEECKGVETYTYYTDAECTVKTTAADGASVEGGDPTYAGTYYVVAKVDATETCEAGSAKASFAIAKKAVTVEWSENLEVEYTGDEVYPEASIKAGDILAADAEKVELVITGAIEAGPQTATASLKGDAAKNYEITTGKTQEFTIKESETPLTPLTLELTREGWTYGEDATTPVLKGNEECKGVETYTYYTDAECTVKTTEADGASVEGGDPTYAGTYYVVAKVAATETCEAGSAKASFAIAKKGVTVVWNPEDEFVYDGKPHYVKIDDVTGIIAGDDVTWDVEEDIKSSYVVGEHIAKAYLDGKDAKNYSIVKNVIQVFHIIGEGTDYIAPQPLSGLAYTGAAQPLTTEGVVGDKDGMFEYTIDGVISYGSRPLVKDAHDYKVSVRFIPTQGTPVEIIKDEIVTIAKAPISLIWSEKTELVYNGAAQAPEVSVDPAGLMGNDVVSLVVAGKEINVGPAEGEEYVATVTGLAESVDASNYYISEDAETSKKFTIIKSDEITFSKPLAKGWKYDGNEYTLLTAGKEITAGTFYYAFEGEELTANVIPFATYPGKYNISYQFVPTDNGYNPSAVETIEVEVLQKEITITDWDSTVFKYNGMTHLPKPEWTGKVGDDDVDLIVEGEQIEIGNGYIATVSLTGTAKDRYTLASNQAIEFSIVSDQVAKPAITEVEFRYNGELHPFVAESENYVITGESGAIEPGIYPVSIVPAEGRVWNDGTTTPVTETFVIKKILVTKPASDKTPFVYTGEELTYKIEESEYYTVSGNVQSEVGKYYVKVALTDKDHYEWIDSNDSDDKIYEFVISTGVVPSPEVVSDLTYEYDGKEKNFEITAFAGSILADSNAVGTDARKYVRTVSLDQEKNGSYIWDDLTDTVKAYTFTIDPQRVILPTAPKTYFIYNGDPFTFEVSADTAAEARYEVEMETTSSSERGTYYAYAYLKDTLNYVWDNAKKTNDTITFAFTIGTGEIEIPEVANSYVYTGQPIVFVPENTAYTVVVEGVDGANGIDVGNYIVTITPNEDFKWLDGSTDAKVRNTKVTEMPIDIPEKPVTPIEYDGLEHFRLKSNPCYDILGDTFGVEPGKYKTTLQLSSSNYMWSDSTKSDLTYVYEITKKKIAYPANDNTIFVYDGEEKTYNLDFDPSICEILYNKQTEAGNYNVTLSITSPYYIFENGLTEKKYSFIINRKGITAPSAPQLVFDFDGNEKEFVINPSEYYTINPENATGVEVGKYVRTVSLADMENFMWVDGSTDDIAIEFEIKSAPISIPTIEKEYYYTGSPITFLKSNSAYTVTNGTQTDAGKYEVVITLNPGFVWKNGTTLDQTIIVEILPQYVEKPYINKTTFAYDGTSQSFGFKTNDGYSFVGDTSAIEPGVYPVVVKLNKNFIWDDDTTDDVEYSFEISKFDVAIPLANSTRYIYNGMEQSYHINIPSDSLFTVSDTIQTNAGTYAVKVALKDPIHYVWSDQTTEDKIYDFVINKATVALPTAPTVNLIYNGNEQNLTVYPSKYYVVNDSNAVATENGKYVRTATLVDTDNYVWVDGTSDYQSIVFIIGDGSIEKPELQLEYTYTGDTIVFLPKDYAYSVVNGAKREVGTYKVVVIPNDGYKWSDGTDTPLIFTVVIKGKVVEKPELQLEYTYTGKIIDFNVPVSEGYTITGVTSEREIGKYKVELNLLPNYMWDDNTTDLASYVISINKKMVTVPPVIDSVYVYNGRRQTYDIALSPDYNITDNVQSEANTYDVTVALADPAHSMWSDSTTEAKTYVFVIEKNKVELPTAVQETFAYDGETHYFEVTDNKAYLVLPNNASASAVGIYNRSVYLKDTVNSVWADGTTTEKTVVFMIGNGVIELPEIIKDTMFTGSPIVLVPESSVYDVENGTQVAAGKYVVTVTLKEGYLWANKTIEPIVDTAVIRHLVVERPVLPADAVYTYDEQIHGVEIPASAGYMVDGFTEAKEPGVYDVRLALNANYMWSDGSLDTMIYTYIIERIKVEIPEQVDSVFTFTGSEITYPIADTLDEYSVTGHHRATAGVHYVTVTLNDTVHYMWADLTDAPKLFEFVIDKYRVPLPLAIKDSFTFDGKVKLFEIVDNINYIQNPRPAAAIDTGLYYRMVTLADTVSCVWADGLTEPKYVAFYILEGLIPSVTIPTDLTYTGEMITLIEESPAYSVINNNVLEAGEYKVIVTPNPGFSWASDGSKTGVVFTVTVHPKVVEIPAASETVFKYNGQPQTYDIVLPADSTVALSGEVQTEVGSYEVVATLKDDKNYIWSDGTVTRKTYMFSITNSEFFVDPIAQSNDGSLDVTPGHILSLDVNVLGNVYKYWVKCDSCPAFNIDTVYISGKVKGIDIMIPDTVKPGIYSVEVGFMSGTIEKKQIVEIRVNYPATDIYLVWNDVLAVDNSSRLFETYQWYKNGAPIEGATKQYYQEIDGLDGYYSCLVNGELFVGPLYFQGEKPLWINAHGGKGIIDVEVVGEIPYGTKIGIYTVDGYEVESKEAEQYMTFEEPSNVYLVKFVGPNQTAKFSTQTVKVLVK